MKARLKTIIISTLSTFIAFTAVTFSSCTPDKCKSINCAYGGVCKSGACVCQTGYEGTECETLTRTKYKGTWNVKERGSLQTSDAFYPVSISDGNSINQISIHNFYNSFTSDVTAFVQGDTINIPQQTINGNTVQGHGYLTGDPYYYQNGKIVLYYSVTNSGGTNDFGLATGNPSIWEH